MSRIAEAHLNTCPRCQKLVDREREQVELAACEHIPQRLLDTDSHTPARWIPWTLATATISMIAVVVLFLLPTSDRRGDFGLRAKGTLSLDVTLLRAGRIIAQSTPLEKLPPLLVGDQLRLRVLGASGRVVALGGCEQHACEILFEGDLPADKWLPIGLTATPGRTRLVLLACGSSVDLQKCLADLDRDGAPPEATRGCHMKTWELMVKP
jgi:hypothetical protein